MIEAKFKKENFINKFLPAIIFFMMLILILNSLLLARTLGYIDLPGEMDRLEVARKAAEMTVAYLEQKAKDAMVYDNAAVREVLAQLKFELEKASTPEEIIEVQSTYGEKVREVIERELDNKRNEAVLDIINKDANVKKFNGETIIDISKIEGKGVVVEDRAGILSENTINMLKQNELLTKGVWPLIEVRVYKGRAEIITSRTLIDRLKQYEKEIENFRTKLQELRVAAGYTELTGSGITVRMYDAEEGYSSIDIVHDRDVRDIVNELFAAGAKGVSVGGQRLVANSSIRCAGPVILVNQQPITVNPIVIQAVGDPDVLASSLDLIRSQLKEFGIRVDISKEKQIKLPAFKEKNSYAEE
ncbi:MAG TPA: hypothetical protein DEA47_02845 [Peptococcaceae bacterium]|nr:MAG: hypothetical protein XD50_1461 [Clostridia bacterium 41_269]HBT20295.1 hypothetical protein [Peptococcaceae bacterium]